MRGQGRRPNGDAPLEGPKGVRLGREGWAIQSSRGAWCVALGVLGVGLALAGVGLVVSGRTDSTAFGQVPAGRAAGPGVVIATQSLGDNDVVVCLVDTAQQRLLVYLVEARRSRMRLVAARDISADWSLTDFNNDPPTPKDVRARAEKAAETGRPAPAIETPKPAAVP